MQVSPFLMVFLLIYFFLRNAENVYHHPSSVGARQWCVQPEHLNLFDQQTRLRAYYFPSGDLRSLPLTSAQGRRSALAQWKLRQLNELPHQLQERLNRSYAPACAYVGQFPSPLVSMGAKFVAFVVGALAAAIIALALVDERLLEAHIHVRNPPHPPVVLPPIKGRQRTMWHLRSFNTQTICTVLYYCLGPAKVTRHPLCCAATAASRLPLRPSSDVAGILSTYM